MFCVESTRVQILAVVACQMILAVSAFAADIEQAKRPNLLLIVTDDQRPDTIGALGNATIRTPNIDTLVRRGVSFVNAYAGYPVCQVSRAEILTGCSAFKALPNYPSGPIDSSLATLAGTFRLAGYETWYSGKWHNDGQPKQRGYSGTAGLFSSGGSSSDQHGPTTDERGNQRTGYVGWTFKDPQGKPEIEKGVGLQPDNSVHIADGAINAIRQTSKEKPFLLHVNFAFPHDPRQWPADPRQRYLSDQMSLPRNFAPTHPFDHGNLQGRDEKLLPQPRSTELLRTELAIYYAMISDVDTQIGRLLAALKDNDRENTIVVFTSDQGLALGSHGLVGKQNQYEHSIRSPLIVARPSLTSGKSVDSLVMLRDIFPTLCELSSVPIPGSVEGVSFVPLLDATRQKIRDFVVGVYTDTQRMIRDGRWKLIVYPRADRVQLFDLVSDPDELNDLSTAAEHSETKQRLRSQLRRLCQQSGDRVDLK